MVNIYNNYLVKAAKFVVNGVKAMVVRVHQAFTALVKWVKTW
jgi:hypothetical protein